MQTTWCCIPTEAEKRQPLSIRFTPWKRWAAFISGLTGKYAAASGAMQMRKIRANGQTGLWIRGEEVLPTLVMIDADGEQIRHIYMVRNPDKMRHVPER